MRKIFVLIAVVVLMLAQSACVTSLQPLATYKTIIMDKRLSGEWMDGENVLSIQPLTESDLLKEDDGSERKISPGETKEEIAFYSKSYVITGKGKGIDYILVGSLSRINDQLFIDIMSLGGKDPQKPKEINTGYGMTANYLPTFSIAKIEFIDNNKLSIKYLNGDFIKEQVSKGNLRLKHEKDNVFGTFLITASSFELKQFLEKYGHDERLYYSKDNTTLTRKG